MHPSKELRSEIRSFIEQNYLLGQSNNFADDASLLEHQVMDSTGVLELVSFLEGHFGVQVADDERSACRGKEFRDGPADAGTPAGDDGDLARQAECI